MDRPRKTVWVARAGLVDGAAQEARYARSAREKERGLSFFFVRKNQEMLSLFSGAREWQWQRQGRSWMQAPPRKQRVRGLRHGTGDPSLQRVDTLAACGRSSLSSLQTLDTYAGTQSEGSGDIPVSPHFVYIVYHKIWRLSKMESGRKRKGRKNLEGAGLREMDTREGACGKEWKGVRWLPPKVPFLTFL